MSFFDQKQEVMDVALTQFGKELLARGSFRPAFYQFFDDGIMYDASYANIQEEQNDTETRILKETPRLKTSHLTLPVYVRYSIEEAEIEAGERGKFEILRRYAPPDIQERILLYPLATQEVANQNVAKFDILALEAPITEVVESKLSASGIQKNIPTLKMNPKYFVTEDRGDLLDKKDQVQITEEDFVDLMSKEIVFSDNSKILTHAQNIVIDVEEINCFDGLGNFYLNIYEVSKTSPNSDERVIRKIDSLEQAKRIFNIKKDKEIEKHEKKDPQSKNYYKRGNN